MILVFSLLATSLSFANQSCAYSTEQDAKTEQTPAILVSAEGIRIPWKQGEPLPKIVVTMPGLAQPLTGQGVGQGAYYLWQPKFPWTPNVDYAITVTIGQRAWKTTYRVPAEAKPEVVRIDPVAKDLPQNLLRLYVHFNVAMKRGEGLRHISLQTIDGLRLNDPFLELDEELWTPDGKRLTIFFDPGRVKRGLRPREEVGPAMLPKQDYQLVVHETWPDAQGTLLAQKYVKTFRIGPPDYELIDPTRWSFTLPPIQAKAITGSIQVEFEKPLDRALVERLLSVVDQDGRSVNVTVTSDSNDAHKAHLGNVTTLWKSGTYRLMIDPRLEDVCGNRIDAPFDVDLDEQSPAKPLIYELSFTVP